MAGILLVAATERELCGHAGLVCGVGPVEAAAATAAALASGRPGAVLHVGLAGALGVDAGALVLGSESVYRDLRAAIPLVTTVRPDAALLAAAQRALPGVTTAAIETSAAVTPPCNTVLQGRVVVEAMEGFGVLRAAALAGVPALEVRAISNELGEADRNRWQIPRGLRTIETALPPLLAALATVLDK